MYICLSCGKGFKGKSEESYAYKHSLAFGHNLFISQSNCSVWCLPDDYEVEDEDLNDVKYNMNPTFTKDYVYLKIDNDLPNLKSLEGIDFHPGYVPINELKGTSYISTAF